MLACGAQAASRAAQEPDLDLCSHLLSLLSTNCRALSRADLSLHAQSGPRREHARLVLRSWAVCENAGCTSYQKQPSMPECDAHAPVAGRL